MRLAMSQIAWEQAYQAEALAILQQSGFAGLEIAPTLVAGPEPYASPEKAEAFAGQVKAGYGLSVCSMQSIWYGQQGSMFGPLRSHFIQYTKQAVLFAKAAGAGNLVFGNPKNRVLPKGEGQEAAVSFFGEIGGFAAQNGRVIALEANPPVYGTNLMNTTAEAFAMARRVNSPGCRVNLDVGTMLMNREEVQSLRGMVKLVNHVHISEPGLAQVEKHALHAELAALLREEGYGGYVSVEMKQQPLAAIQKTAEYVAEVFA